MRVLAYQLLKVRQEHRWRECRNSNGDDKAPRQKHAQSHACSKHWTMGPERAMGDQTSVRPPEEAEGSPAPQRVRARIKIGGKPEPTSQTARCGDQCCLESQHQPNSDSEREAQDPDALVVAATRCQAFGALVRPQSDALRQNLPGGAISSAVEHLPYKEIVTGSIPVSPISKIQSCTGMPRGSHVHIGTPSAGLCGLIVRTSDRAHDAVGHC